MTGVLLFDFDGLILDTETTDFESWAQAYREHGAELPRDLWVETIGTDGSGFQPFTYLCEAAGRQLDERAVRSRRSSRRDAMVASLRPLPGVLDWIRAARDRQMGVAVVSSSPTDWVAQHLDNVAMTPLFDFLMTADRVERAKPHPELYLRALAEYGVPATEAIALEDSPHGVAAARAAGIFCVAIPGPMTRSLSFDAADLVLDSLASRSLAAVLGARGESTRTAGIGSE